MRIATYPHTAEYIADDDCTSGILYAHMTYSRPIRKRDSKKANSRTSNREGRPRNQNVHREGKQRQKQRYRDKKSRIMGAAEREGEPMRNKRK